MKDINKSVSLLCPRCGNDQFSSLDVDFDNLGDAPGSVRVKCSDCGLVITKEELEKENLLIINNTIDEIVEDAKQQVIKEINKIIK